MQTFLPRPSFPESAEILDDKRLCKQITECKQIALAILDPSYGWQHHPAVNMWREHYGALLQYGAEMYIEWMHRHDTGKRGGCKFHKAGEWIMFNASTICDEMPSWLGDAAQGT